MCFRNHYNLSGAIENKFCVWSIALFISHLFIINTRDINNAIDVNNNKINNNKFIIPMMNLWQAL